MHHIMFILFKSLIAVNWDDRSPTLSGSVQHFNFLLVSRIETFFFICNYLKCLKTQHSTQQSWLLSNDCEGGKLRYLHRIVFWNIKLTLICLMSFLGGGSTPEILLGYFLAYKLCITETLCFASLRLTQCWLWYLLFAECFDILFVFSLPVCPWKTELSEKDICYYTINDYIY